MPVINLTRLAGLLLVSTVALAANTDLYSGTAVRSIRTIDVITLTDPVQQRDIHVRLHLPENATGLQPVVIYSHGAFCSPAMYDRITMHWAAHGYVVLIPEHLDALENAGTVRQTDVSMLLSARIRDLSFLLDAADDIESAVGMPIQLDTQRAAVAGHSFGGMIAQIKSGLLLKPDSYLFDGEPADARFKLAVIMSGVGPMPQMADAAFDGLQGPLLATGGTLDEGNVGSGVIFPWEWRLSPYTLAPAGDKFSVVLENGDHYLGGLICREDRGGPADPEGVAIVAAVSTAFLDAYLRHDEAAAQWLQHEDLAKLTGSRARLSRK